MFFAWEIQNLWRMLRTFGIKLGLNWHVIPIVALHYTSVVIEELVMMAYLGGQSTLARFNVRWEIENPWGHKQSCIRVLVISNTTESSWIRCLLLACPLMKYVHLPYLSVPKLYCLCKPGKYSLRASPMLKVPPTSCNRLMSWPTFQPFFFQIIIILTLHFRHEFLKSL